MDISPLNGEIAAISPHALIFALPLMFRPECDRKLGLLHTDTEGQTA
jgi:hypothetical protein